jgi:cell division protein FtsL
MTRRRTNAAAVDRQHAVFWLIAAVVVYLAVALSGVWVASLGQDVRGLFVALEQNQRTQDALLAEYSRLLIERGTLSSYQNVDQVAEQQLTMRFPEIVERVTP